MANPYQMLHNSVFSLTISLGSLANDSTNLLAGRSSAAVDNSSNKYTEILLSGKITAGTSPTVGNTIELWGWAAIDDNPNSIVYPDTITGSDANITLTSINVKQVALSHIMTISVDATTDRPYYIRPTPLSRLWNGIPRTWGIFVLNATGAALNATGGNHYFRAQPFGLQI